MKDNKKNQDRIQKFLLSPVTTAGAFVLAAVLLIGSGIGVARAALTYRSQQYESRISMLDTGVTLIEAYKTADKKTVKNDISWRNYNYDKKKIEGSWNQNTGVLLKNRWNTKKNGKVISGDMGEFLKIGKLYDEILSVRNSGKINGFVRVTLYKYWSDSDGNKIDPDGKNPEVGTTTLHPDLIDLQLDDEYVAMQGDNPGDKKWLRDSAASTEERTVLYYGDLLLAGVETKPFTKFIRIKPEVSKAVYQFETVDKENDKHKTITTVYAYDGYSFTIEATVDIVQEHNAEAAVKSAWGKKVTVEEVTVDGQQTKRIKLGGQ